MKKPYILSGIKDLPSELSNAKSKNRITLWANALANTQSSLFLVKRSSSWSESDVVRKEIEMNGNNFFSDYRDNMKGRPFPTLFECDDIKFTALTSALIYYCQLLTIGYADREKIEGNTSELQTQLWDYAFDFLLEEHQIPKERVEKLNKLLIDTRNSFIAHADASKMKSEFDKEGKLTSFGSYEEGFEDIDIDFWLDVVSELKNLMNIVSSR